MKIAVSGKGGVGKTTLSAMLAGALGLRGAAVVAVDADPDANLASALGLDPAERITPLAEMRQLIEERTGSRGSYGAFFQLNPRVDDIPEKYARRVGPIRLLVLGGMKKGGEGCMCPATALLKALLVHLVLGRDEHLVMDMEAGIEHLGRATAESMDALLVVVDPTAWSIQTAHRVRKLAGDVGLRNVLAVANRVGRAEQVEAIRRGLGDVPLIGQVPADERIQAGLVGTDARGGLVAREGLQANLSAVESILEQVRGRVASPGPAER